MMRISRIRKIKVHENEYQDTIDDDDDIDSDDDLPPDDQSDDVCLADAVQESDTDSVSTKKDTYESIHALSLAVEARYRARATSPLKAIRGFCVMCMGGQPGEVAKCTAPKCFLFPYRMGTNPHQKHREDSKTRLRVPPQIATRQ